MYQNKTVLVTPLNWGLGHATRMVPVIEQLLQQNAKVIIAADKRPFDYLTLRFPKIKIIRFPGYEPRYPTNSMMALSLLMSFSSMWIKSLKAHKYLQKIVVENEIDIIVSDNRFESYSRNTYNIFITHQLQIHTKGLQSIFKTLINKLNFSFIKKYHELWIPDLKDLAENLSGELSHITDYPIKNYLFIGPLSRFTQQETISNYRKIDLLVILSGPEPQRTLFEELISEQATKSSLNTIIVLGKPEEEISFQKENISYISHANDAQMSAMIQSAELIISRPGYSTIMDLCVFGKKAIFIPTPGQTEQLYLADKMKSKGYCYSEEQHIFSLERSIIASGNFSGLPKITSNNKLALTISKLLKKELL